jgi:hypothetical protein
MLVAVRFDLHGAAMTAAHLRPCPGCSRHIRVSGGTCPFCIVSLDPSFSASAAPIAPSRRLSRAALFAFGTGSLVLTPAVAIDCGSTSEAAYGGSAVPPYGIEPLPDGGEEPQDGARVLADVQVGSVEAGDASEGGDLGTTLEDSATEAGDDAGTDGAARDAPDDAGGDAESEAGDAD